MRTRITNQILSLFLGASALLGLCLSASADDNTGSIMARVGVTVVHPDSSADVFAGGARIAGADAEVSTEAVPSLTLAYFLTNNVAVELFCCFAKHEVGGKGALNGVDLGDTWIFPPALTLQYHFDNERGFKPYVGVGVQYIAFFDEGRGSLAGNPRLDLDNAFGFTLQAGVDVEIGNGWYLNGDVKRTFLDTDASWQGTNITADVDLDPWLFTAALGRRFNLFGPAPIAPVSYK
ncbi:MAG: outer membrane beta-barrel protein [Hyphomicrobiaceae bacterium]|nr:outer membrane beta-barrel protein [Hyphomicrobiaceae bacterium]